MGRKSGGAHCAGNPWDATAMSLPRLLLVCDDAPGGGGVGEIFLRELCSGYPHDKLAFAVVGSPPRNEDPQFESVPKCYARWGTYLPNVSGNRVLAAARRHIRFRYAAFRERKMKLPQFLQFATEQTPDLVWAVLSSPSIFRMAPVISKHLSRPLVSTIWDPPEGIGLQYGLDRVSRRVATQDFFRALKSSVRCSVISEAMDREYTQYSGSRTILRHGIDDGTVRPANVSEPNELRIGFCGSLYATDTWEYFMKGLDKLSWKLAGRPVRVIVAGKQCPRTQANCPARIEFLGWRPMNEIIEIMGTCHFLYLPYWFNPAYADSVRLCFPTKLTTYLTAGRPTFFHGPSTASVIAFFDRFRVGHGCHHTDPSAIAADLSKFAEDVLGGTEFESEIHRAVEEELNFEVFHRRFRELLGVS